MLLKFHSEMKKASIKVLHFFVWKKVKSSGLSVWRLIFEPEPLCGWRMSLCALIYKRGESCCFFPLCTKVSMHKGMFFFSRVKPVLCVGLDKYDAH